MVLKRYNIVSELSFGERTSSVLKKEPGLTPTNVLHTFG